MHVINVSITLSGPRTLGGVLDFAIRDELAFRAYAQSEPKAVFPGSGCIRHVILDDVSYAAEMTYASLGAEKGPFLMAVGQLNVAPLLGNLDKVLGFGFAEYNEHREPGYKWLISQQLMVDPDDEFADFEKIAWPWRVLRIMSTMDTLGMFDKVSQG